jgi:hypothetical protein
LEPTPGTGIVTSNGISSLDDPSVDSEFAVATEGGVRWGLLLTLYCSKIVETAGLKDRPPIGIFVVKLSKRIPPPDFFVGEVVGERVGGLEGGEVGEIVGREDGDAVGGSEGEEVGVWGRGAGVGRVGCEDGENVGFTDGAVEGETLGDVEGNKVGRREGLCVGSTDGENVGGVEGERVGLQEGSVVGEAVVGLDDGAEEMVGLLVGFRVGDLVGAFGLRKVGANVGALGKTGLKVGGLVG